MFGAPAAMQIWNAFHAYMVSKGFAERVALEGVSRGGLYVYNWPKRNPLKVACIYAEAQQTIEQFYGINTNVVKATMPESASAHDRVDTMPTGFWIIYSSSIPIKKSLP
jgi:hypothetical protein